MWIPLCWVRLKFQLLETIWRAWSHNHQLKSERLKWLECWYISLKIHLFFCTCYNFNSYTRQKKITMKSFKYSPDRDKKKIKVSLYNFSHAFIKITTVTNHYSSPTWLVGEWFWAGVWLAFHWVLGCRWWLVEPQRNFNLHLKFLLISTSQWDIE